MVDLVSEESVPGRDDIEAAMLDLASGKKSRKEVSDWAYPWVYDDDLPEVEDELAWDALDLLTSADTQSSPGVYIFQKNDFQKWLNEFRRRR
ncbi:hypothetical protein GCM10020366_24040 [Saccharopolyspora gregorii]|uniref:Uncharacterized protein n=1 Tax=Saccharopolyspora gregorii TaxID=33914 RepID=A0ABP6RPI2_9PSEU